MGENMTLVQLQEIVQQGVREAVPEPVWVTAEISSVKESPSGHCYMELVEWTGSGGGLAAKARAVIWNSSYLLLKPLFESSTGCQLQVGMHLLLYVQVQYSPLYGLTLVVIDIDPAFTVGEMEMARQKTIERLKKEGLMEMNSSLPMPRLPHRVAVVSSPTAAGYADFMKHIRENVVGVNIQTELFVSPMQGEEAPSGIIAALETIAQGEFDVVVIIRGGGSVTDLAPFDDYDLAVNIANFPIPVITGVGHEIDFHVCDMVAHTWQKTPTAVADYLIEIFAQECEYLDSLESRMVAAVQMKVRGEESRIELLKERLKGLLASKMDVQESRIAILEAKVKAVVPQEVLSRGFAMIYSNGERLRALSGVAEGDLLQIVMGDGILRLRASDVEYFENENSK